MYPTPILLILFNRPGTTRQVFEAIARQKPAYLYVAADGPRPGNREDPEKCRAARDVIQVDWDCEVHTLFRDENRGCGRGPAEAMNWFFGQVEYGIILEDDIVPGPAFFPYCSELLERYKNDERVAMISGINLLNSWKPERSSYFFSYMGGIPGWATWRRSWANFDMSLSTWKNQETRKRISKLLGNRQAYRHFSGQFDHFYQVCRHDVWDYQWLFSRWSAGGCSIVPSVNLMTNVGFGPDATHTVTADHPQANLVPGAPEFPLVHPSFTIDRDFDRVIFNRFVQEKPIGIVKRGIRLVRRILVALRQNRKG